jgi:uncharacterized cupredoxin-like copper-binding protein
LEGGDVIVDRGLAGRHRVDGEVARADLTPFLDLPPEPIGVIGRPAHAGLHADGPGIAARFPCGGTDDLESLLESVVRLDPAEPSVGEASDASAGGLGQAPDPDRDGSLDGQRRDTGAGEGVERARVRDRPLGAQSPEQLDLFGLLDVSTSRRLDARRRGGVDPVRSVAVQSRRFRTMRIVAPDPGVRALPASAGCRGSRYETTAVTRLVGTQSRHPRSRRGARRGRPITSRRRRISTGIALIGILGGVAGCASTPSSTGADSLEGGIKIPTLSSSTKVKATTVNVTLSDTKGLGGPMTLVVSPATAPAGDVTFVVKNTGTIDHEAIVLKTNVAFDKLPINNSGDPPAPVTSGANKVGEDTNIGETGDPNLKPGVTRTFTIKNMTAGNYDIVCNLAQHYGKGMRAPFTIG